jgi:hypothetical protein
MLIIVFIKFYEVRNSTLDTINNNLINFLSLIISFEYF